MLLYSQHDPAYDRLTMAPNVTIHQYGCALMCVANLFQVNPVDLLRVHNAFNAEGELDFAVLAAACGGRYLGIVTGFAGWGIAVTDHYKNLGYNTHFFNYFPQENTIIDPLDFPPLVKTRNYNIVQLRAFEGVRLGSDTLEPTYPIIPQAVAPQVEVTNLERRAEHEENPVRHFSLERLILRLMEKFHISSPK